MDESMNRMNRPIPNLNDGYLKNQAKKVDNRANSERKFVEAYNNSRQADSLSGLTIVMQPDSTPPAQVIILGKAEGIAQRKPVVIVDTLEPAEGWAIFDDYIANNLKAPEEIKLKSMTGGEVQLSFEVDRNGEPINIAVVKSLCQQCDAEAIRLLREGPRWKRNTRKGKITIRF
jgi:hypothetical protein